MFWGFVLLLVGLIIVANAVFGFNLPVIRVLIGFCFVYLGIKIAFGSAWRNWTDFEKRGNPEKGQIIFNEGKTSPRFLSDLDGRSFNVVFGEGKLDLTQTELGEKEELEINTVFGSAKIYLPSDVAVQASVTSFAGTTKIPETTSTHSNEQKLKTLKLEVNTVFGSTQVEVK